ncbi:MAG: Loki-CTERM sorting domain-containing protein [Candidatus Odinarchaeota archaeon]
MKRTKFLISIVVLMTITLAVTPPVIPQIGTYEFHGAAGQQKILKVRTVNNASLADLFGPSWVSVIEVFKPGAANVGARFKSVVNAVFNPISLNYSVYGLGFLDAAMYNTSSWYWTTGAFDPVADSIGDFVTGFYNPADLVAFINAFWYSIYSIPYNISMHTAGAFMAQLPTDVEQYLGALIWEPKWENIGNTVVHHAEALDYNVPLYSFQYLENCTETWTYDKTYGAWIGYSIKDDANNVIYEFSIELPGGIPGYEIPLIIGVAGMAIISVIYVVMKKKRI